MKKIVPLVVVLFVSMTSLGQDEKIIVIDKGPGYRSARQKKERTLVENNSVVKFNVLQMMVGELAFAYERPVNDAASIEFEFGPTFSNIGFSVNDNHYYDPWGSMNYAQETSGLGFFGSVGYRFYPIDNGLVLNNFYVSPVLKYRLMNFGIKDYSGNLDETKGNEDHLYFTFNFGYQLWLAQRFSLDFYAGMGLGYESHLRYDMISEYDGVTGQYTYYWDRNAYSGARYVFTMGMKVGIGN